MPPMPDMVCCPTCWSWSKLGQRTTCRRCGTPLITADGWGVGEVGAAAPTNTVPSGGGVEPAAARAVPPGGPVEPARSLGVPPGGGELPGLPRRQRTPSRPLIAGVAATLVIGVPAGLYVGLHRGTDPRDVVLTAAHLATNQSVRI